MMPLCITALYRKWLAESGTGGGGRHGLEAQVSNIWQQHMQAQLCSSDWPVLTTWLHFHYIEVFATLEFALWFARQIYYWGNIGKLFATWEVGNTFTFTYSLYLLFYLLLYCAIYFFLDLFGFPTIWSLAADYYKLCWWVWFVLLVSLYCLTITLNPYLFFFVPVALLIYNWGLLFLFSFFLVWWEADLVCPPFKSSKSWDKCGSIWEIRCSL